MDTWKQTFRWLALTLCFLHSVSSKPVILPTTSRHAEPYTEQSVPSIVVARSESSTTPVSSDHNKSTAARSTTTAGHVIYNKGKVSVTAANLFVSGVQGLLGTDHTPVATEITGLSTDAKGQAATADSASEQNNDEIMSSDSITINVTKVYMSSPTTESIITSAGYSDDTSPGKGLQHMMTTDSFMDEDKEQQTTTSESTWQNETIMTESHDVVTTGQLQSSEMLDSGNAELEGGNRALEWVKNTAPETRTTDEDTTTQLRGDSATESPGGQTTSSVTEGIHVTEYETASDNNGTDGTLATDSSNLADKTSTMIGQDTTELHPLSVELDHTQDVTAYPDATIHVTKSTQKRSAPTATAQPASTKSNQQTVTGPTHHPSDSCTDLRYIWELANATESDAEDAMEHYCTHQDVVDAILEGNHSDCRSLARWIVTEDPDVIFPNVADTLANGTSLTSVLNIGLQAAIEHRYLITNSSDLEERSFCKPAQDNNMECSYAIYCVNKPPTQPGSIFFWNTHDLARGVDGSLNYLIMVYTEQMPRLGVEDNSDPNVDIQPPVEVEKELVRKYTLGGFHNTIEQMRLIQRGLEAICDNIPLIDCGLELEHQKNNVENKYKTE